MTPNGIKFEMKINPKDESSADLYVYDGVGYPWLDSESNASTAQKFSEMLENAGDVKNLNIHINSGGGLCSDGVAIYSLIKNHKAHKTAYVDGYACSIATLIAAACDKVVMSTPATMMIHNALTFEYGNARTLRATANALDKITEGIKSAYLLRAGNKITAEKLNELMDGEDGNGTWLTAKECVEYGFCDEITQKSEETPKSEPKDESEPKSEPKSSENKDYSKIMNVFGAFML